MVWTTHTVFNQPKPLGNSNLFLSDTPLREALQREQGGWDAEVLASLGQQLGTQESLELGRLANANPVNADDSLSQATDSALRGVIGKYSMDRILTEGRTVVRNDTQRMLEETIRPYNMGITLLDVNFQAARPPEEVKASFDDAIAARENEQQYIREAEAYANEVQPRANGQAQRLLEDSKAYKDRTVLEAQGEVARFAKLLPEYKSAPQITRERLYIETMEKVLGHTRKVLVSDKGNNLMVLPLDQMLRGQGAATESGNKDTSLIRLNPNPAPAANSSAPRTSGGSIMDQRRANAQRDDTTRVGRE